MAPSGSSAPAVSFGVRFGYACWLYYLRAARAPSFAAIGRVAGRTGEAVAAWATAKTPPTDFQVHEPTATFLGVDERWLFRSQGDPPRPELWRVWLEARVGKGRTTAGGKMYYGTTGAVGAVAETKPAAKKSGRR